MSVTHGRPYRNPANPDQAGDYYASMPDLTPTAIEPQRVLILNEDDQHLILSWAESVDHPIYHELVRRITHGDTYADEMDELARTTLRKRRLETEIKRCNQIIERLTEPVVERLAEIGAKSLTHEASGTRIQRDDKCYLKYADQTWDDDEKTYARMRAGEAMRRLPAFEGFIHETYNAQSVGAYVAELYKAALAAELEKPEHERQPVEPDSVIPDELREWLVLSVRPRVKVTAT